MERRKEKKYYGNRDQTIVGIKQMECTQSIAGWNDTKNKKK